MTTLLAAAGPAAAAPDEEAEFFSLEKATLEEALNAQTSVATRSKMCLRDTPGLVTVITAGEIQAMGARSLTDVLRLVPEFEFGADVQNNLGIGVRGLWGNEGKVLVIWDGQVYNETLYSTVQYDRFPVDQIEEIEIIKGPGSVVYGGFAELAVINIRTKTYRTLKGGEAYAAYGQGRLARARQYGGISYNERVGAAAELSAKAFWGEAQRSDARYTDAYGSSYGMNGQSALRPQSLNLAVSDRNGELRLMADDYSLRERDHFDHLMSTGDSRVAFPSLSAGARYAFYLPGMVRIEPRVSYSRAQAWQQKSPADIAYDKQTERVTAALNAYYEPSVRLDLEAGGEYYHDSVSVRSITASDGQYASGAASAGYDNGALFGQASWNLDIASLNAGLRYDKNSQYGAAMSPRLAATKVAGPLNFKAIYSRAFHAPSIENIRLNPGIKPEKSSSEEFEAGYKASETVYVSANVFHTMITDPIVFDLSSGKETYSNYGRTGSKGAGLNLKYKEGGLRADLGYLHYFTDCNRVDIYAVPAHGSYLLGFPKHKVVLNASAPLGRGFSLDPTVIYVSRRYGYSEAGLRSFGGAATADLNLLAKDAFTRGLTLSLGVKDMFASGYSYIQPYDGGHAPLPAASREVFAKASYAF